MAAISAANVQIIVRTWNDERHNLFNFEANPEDVQTETFDLPLSSGGAHFNRNDSMINMSTDMSQAQSSLLMVKQDGICEARVSKFDKGIWAVIRDRPLPLSQGHFLKLGRSVLRVAQVEAADSEAPSQVRKVQGIRCLNVKSQDAPMDAVCRICLMEGGSGDAKLITPCNCKGTIEHVHLGCLRTWANIKFGASSSDTSYVYPKLQCELCGGDFPDVIQMDSEQLPLLQIPDIKPPFIVFENLQSHSFHMVSLSQCKAITLGRGSNVDVKIHDMSLSRVHAMVRYEDGQFLLEDNNSRFGTTVKLRSLKLEAGGEISIQCGRSVFDMQLVPLSKSLSI